MSVQALETVGDGAILSYSTDDAAYTDFAEIIDITSPKITPPEVKTNNLSDTSVKTQPGSKVDYGEAGITLKFKKAILTTIMGWISAGTILYFRITVVDGAATHQSIAKFQAWVKELDPFGELKENEMVQTKVSFRVTGALTFTQQF